MIRKRFLGKGKSTKQELGWVTISEISEDPSSGSALGCFATPRQPQDSPREPKTAKKTPREPKRLPEALGTDP